MGGRTPPRPRPKPRLRMTDETPVVGDSFEHALERLAENDSRLRESIDLLYRATVIKEAGRVTRCLRRDHPPEDSVFAREKLVPVSPWMYARETELGRHIDRPPFGPPAPAKVRVYGLLKRVAFALFRIK